MEQNTPKNKFKSFLKGAAAFTPGPVGMAGSALLKDRQPQATMAANQSATTPQSPKAFNSMGQPRQAGQAPYSTVPHRTILDRGGLLGGSKNPAMATAFPSTPAPLGATGQGSGVSMGGASTGQVPVGGGVSARQAADDFNAQWAMGQQGIRDKVIPLEFQTGQTASLDRTAGIQANALETRALREEEAAKAAEDRRRWEAEFGLKRAAAARSGGGGFNPNKLLSIAEAKSLGVPYGTTHGQAFGQSPRGEMTASQGAAQGYANRLNQASEVIDQVGGQFTGIDKAIPLPNFLQSAERQQFEQAKRNFVNSVLRRESGAAISNSEFKNAERQYFPQPGDSQAVLQQKKQNRDLVFQNFMTEAGSPMNQSIQPSGGSNIVTAPDGQQIQIID